MTLSREQSLLDLVLPRWPDTTTSQTGADILLRYTEPHRRYHDLQHLVDMFAAVDELDAHGAQFDSTALAYAIFFHDAVYDGDRDDEARSAVLARVTLTGLKVGAGLIDRVVGLVENTTTHEAHDEESAVFMDADLWILSAEPERYLQYTRNVRDEYAHLDDSSFAIGRSHVLQHLLTGGIYTTPHARNSWENRARANVEAELSDLTSATQRQGTKNSVE